MNELFLRFINLSISASWLVLAVLILRIVLKRAPKWVNVLLWGIVAVRLISPFSIESTMSLIPSAETIPMNIELDAAPAIDSGIEAINSAINPVISASFAPQPSDSANPLQAGIRIASILWIAGIVAMLLYAAVSYWRLRRMVDTAVLYRDNIFQSENVSSPFVFGFIRPKIYLPFNMNGQDLEYVVAHEEAHIRRRDHWWKPLGFLLLTLHWFNPLMWLAYVLLCRDIELACDEKIIKGLDNEERADYTQALVSCSVRHRRIAVCPLAFGEVGVKERVKSVMNYRKPAFWIIVLAIVACVVVAVSFLTNPEKPRELSLVDEEPVEPPKIELNYAQATASQVRSAEEVNFPDCVSFSLPEGLTAGEFDIYLGIGGGIPLYNDEGEMCGCFELHLWGGNIFKDGELIQIALFENHGLFVGNFIRIESSVPCVVNQYSRDVYDESAHKYVGREIFLYAFWAKEGYTPQYALYLTSDDFEPEDLRAIAKTVTFSDEAFVIITEEEESIQNPLINDGAPSRD